MVFQSGAFEKIKGGPKVGIQYIVYSLLYTYIWPILYKGQDTTNDTDRGAGAVGMTI
jgi:hypothetical protein